MEYRLKTTFQNELYFIFTTAYNVSDKTTIKTNFYWINSDEIQILSLVISDWDG